MKQPAPADPKSELMRPTPTQMERNSLNDFLREAFLAYQRQCQCQTEKHSLQKNYFVRARSSFFGFPEFCWLEMNRIEYSVWRQQFLLMAIFPHPISLCGRPSAFGARVSSPAAVPPELRGWVFRAPAECVSRRDWDIRGIRVQNVVMPRRYQNPASRPRFIAVSTVNFADNFHFSDNFQVNCIKSAIFLTYKASLHGCFASKHGCSVPLLGCSVSLHASKTALHGCFVSSP